MLNKDIFEVLGFGVIHFYDGELYAEDRPDSDWNVTCNHDSGVLSFRFDEHFTSKDLLRVIKEIYMQEGTEGMSFGKALDLLKSGEVNGITRYDWYGSHASPTVRLQRPDEHSKMTEPYLYMEKNGPNDTVMRFPLDLSCESVLSDNWVVVD